MLSSAAAFVGEFEAVGDNSFTLAAHLSWFSTRGVDGILERLGCTDTAGVTAESGEEGARTVALLSPTSLPVCGDNGTFCGLGGGELRGATRVIALVMDECSGGALGFGVRGDINGEDVK